MDYCDCPDSNYHKDNCVSAEWGYVDVLVCNDCGNVIEVIENV